MCQIKNTIKFCVSLCILWCSVISAISATELGIISYGDSITAGLIRVTGGSISCPPGVALEPPLFADFDGLVCNGNGAEGVGGYQTILKSKLEELGFDTSIYNFGYSGLFTFEMRDLLNLTISAEPDADYVLIMGGANDAFNGISGSTVLFNFQSMINTACANSMIPVVTSVTRRVSPDSINSTVINYNNLINSISNPSSCSSKNIELIIADQYTATIDGFNFSDGLHLTETGNTNMANEWFSALNLERISSIIMAPIYLLLDD